MAEKVDFEMVLSSAASLPMVKIDRETFLRKELRKLYDDTIVNMAVKNCPAYAGIDTSQIDKIAKSCIAYETTKVTSLSALSGLPGGLAMIGTVPADLTQYFGHILRILQKLVYLYGWDELFGEDGKLDDETSNMLTLFVGVMFRVNGAATTISKVSASAAQKASKSIAQKALTKGTIYPMVKKLAQVLGVQMTKEIFAKGVAKAIPIIGAVGSGVLTYATYKPMAYKLKKYLEKQKWADVNYYMNVDKKVELVSDAHDVNKCEIVPEKQMSLLEEKSAKEVIIIDMDDK